MPNARIEIRPAFRFTEALNYSADQPYSAFRTKPPLFKPGDDVAQAAYGLSELVRAIAHSMWISGAISASALKQMQDVLQERRLTLVREPFVHDVEQQYTARTAAALTDELRDRVMHAWSEGYNHRTGHYAGIADLTLFAEIMREGIVDYAANSTRVNYKVRRCAWCGRWFEPQLSGRSRFCQARCRQEFNNARLSAQEEVRAFKCDVCEERLPLEHYSGLHRTDDPWRLESPIETALSIDKRGDPEPVCVTCVRDRYPEWSKYVAVIDTKRDVA